MFKQDENMLISGAMPLDHLFIQDYLPAASGDCVRVYIYGLFLSQHPRSGMSLEVFANDLHMEPAQVEYALRYWERKRLVTRVKDNPPEYVFRSALFQAMNGEKGMDYDAEYVEFNAAVHTLFPAKKGTKFDEQILSLWTFMQDTGLTQEIVFELIAQMQKTHERSFTLKLVEQEAAKMAEAGVKTAEDARAYLAHSGPVYSGATAVLRNLSIFDRLPTEAELQLYVKWTEEWNCSQAEILEVCQTKTANNRYPTFAYINGILEPDPETRSRRLLARTLGLDPRTERIVATYRRWLEHFDPETIQLVAEEAQRQHKGLDEVEKQLNGFQKLGLDAPDQVRAYFDEVHRLNPAILALYEKCGHRGAPTPSDRALYKKWLEWGTSEELLALAAGQAQGVRRPMPYIDKILEGWRAAGVTTAAQAQAQKPPQAATVGRRVSAQQYTQRAYSEEELENRVDDL